MENQNMTDYLPQVRCLPKTKAGLKDIASRSVAPNIADHIRYAVEMYITYTNTGLLPSTHTADITLRETA